MVNELKIFMSSTQKDLKEARWLTMKFLAVLRSDLISMEIFGSDETKPKEFCLRQVEHCNLFIGIYAERYGSIDKETSLSISELEYQEAYGMLKKGKLIGLLVYIIDPTARWPLDMVDRYPESLQKLKELKARLMKNHTVTFFNSIDELPFLVLSDVVRKIGLSAKQLFQPKKPPRFLFKKVIDRPVGMEYYTAELSPLFHGREAETNGLIFQVIKHKMSLLIGASGIGKTSLIHAGLFPQLRKLGWKVALVRPLTQPMENLRRSLWGQLLEGIIPNEFDFASVLYCVAKAHKDANVLIVIDQFEDILGPKASGDIDRLTQALVHLYESLDANLRLLIIYRGDVEAQIGTIWQKVSGSAEGLPRAYLGPLTKEGCEQILNNNLKALGITLGDACGKESQKFITQIVEDLANESYLNGYPGIYPPFTQMLISRAFVDANNKKCYTKANYIAAGQSRRIIADYLINQLRYLGRNEPKGRSVLIALVSSYGTKTQKTAEEIAIESSQSLRGVEKLLRQLINLRMVRGINNHYEIVHDYLVKTIIKEIVSTEEREAKKFKDLLASRAAAYTDTRASLTKAEHLHIYKYRHSILCTEEEIQLLLKSYLAGNGPINYWLNPYEKEKIIAWLRPSLDDENLEIRRNAYRFMIKYGKQMPLQDVVELFSDYNLKAELGKYILKLTKPQDIPLLLRLYRKKAEEVAFASEKALIKLVFRSNEKLLIKLAKSNADSNRKLFEKLSLKFANELPLGDIRSMCQSKVQWQRLVALYALGVKGIKQDFQWLQELLVKKKLNKKYRIASVKSSVRLSLRLGKVNVVRALLKNKDPLIIRVSLEAVERSRHRLKLKEILPHYKSHPWETAKAVRVLASKRDLPILRKTLRMIKLDPPARNIVLAVCEQGRQEEFKFLFKLFLNCNHRITFWNALVVFRDIAKLAPRLNLSLLDTIIDSREFWKWYDYLNRPRQKIRIKEFENLYFIKRLVGVTYANIVGRRQLRKLRKLIRHNYWLIRDAAADAIIRLAKKSDLPQLIDYALSSEDNSDAIIKVLCALE